MPGTPGTHGIMGLKGKRGSRGRPGSKVKLSSYSYSTDLKTNHEYKGHLNSIQVGSNEMPFTYGNIQKETDSETEISML